MFSGTGLEGGLVALVVVVAAVFGTGGAGNPRGRHPDASRPVITTIPINFFMSRSFVSSHTIVRSRLRSMWPM